VHLWAERFDRSIDDIFALQDEITLNVVGAIEPSLRPAEIKRVERKRPSDLNAYDLVLRAIPLAHSVMPDGASRGLTLLEQALALEPDYAAAHGYAAWCHEILFLHGGFLDDVLEAKRLELLHEVVPNVGVIALLVNPNNTRAEAQLRDTQEAAARLGIWLIVLSASNEPEIDTSFAILVLEGFAIPTISMP
jgi:hypothetical protein